MKKLFVLFLCLMAVTGFVSAGIVHPPGETLEALPGYGVHEAVVTPDTVLIVETLTYGILNQILEVSDMIPQKLSRATFIIEKDQVVCGVPKESVDYPLRL
jgi:hypothetical protein